MSQEAIIKKDFEEPAVPKPKFSDRIGFSHIFKQLPRTLLALSFTLSQSMFMTSMQAVSDNRAIAAGIHRQADSPLPDVIMEYAHPSIPMYMADAILNPFIFFSIIMFLFSWKWRCARYGLAEGHYRTFRIARSFLWMLGTAYLFRAFSLLSTTMPPTDPRCQIKHRNWIQISLMVFEIMTKQGNTCTDKIFSGHSSMATLICLFWLGALLRPEQLESPDETGPGKTKISLFRKLSALGIVTWTSLVYLFCILCRNHYSIDIVVAIMVCTGIFSFYQLNIRLIELLKINQASDHQKIFKKSPSAISIPQPSENFFYSPLKDDPEAAVTTCESPTIAMQDILGIKEIQDTDKSNHSNNAVDANEKLLLSTKVTHLTYIPRPFVFILRGLSWMDGFDLKP